MNKKTGYRDTTTTTWEEDRDRLKTLWVVSVLIFWATFLFQGALYFLQGKINFILVSIVLGMMVLGVALKIRLQRHLESRSGDE